MTATSTSQPLELAGDLSPSDREAAGKAAREQAPRSSHGAWKPASDRPDPVDVLEGQAADRVADLVPLRYGRMLVSAFTFYRGAAAIMAADLTATPTSGLWVQACGDAHLSNFGAYGSPDRGMVVDINDFDETLPGPWEWDLKRLAASFEIAGRDRGFKAAQRRKVALAAVEAYCENMGTLAALSNLDVWYRRVHIDEIRDRLEAGFSEKELKRFDKNVAKARRKDRLRAFSKLTERVDGELRIRSDHPVLVPLRDQYSGKKLETAKKSTQGIVVSYGETLQADRRHLLDRYHLVDVARKVVGVGSVGTRAWIALLIGRDETDPLFLQIKEAQPSVLEPYAAPTEFAKQGQRVVEGQRLTQAASDIFLGWLTAKGPDGKERDFYVRQLWDQKGSAVVEMMSPAQLTAYAHVCGAILARAHARTGDRFAIAGYLGGGSSFCEAIADFADAYADQNDADFKALKQAEADGRIAVEVEEDRG